MASNFGSPLYNGPQQSNVIYPPDKPVVNQIHREMVGGNPKYYSYPPTILPDYSQDISPSLTEPRNYTTGDPTAVLTDRDRFAYIPDFNNLQQQFQAQPKTILDPSGVNSAREVSAETGIYSIIPQTTKMPRSETQRTENKVDIEAEFLYNL